MLVFFFFWLGSCPLGLKVFHWERKLLSFLDFDCFQYFGGIYIYLNSVLLVFLFSGFLFSFSFLGDKHGCLISEIRPWQDSCLKNDRLWISRTLLRAPPRTCPGEGVVLAPTEALLTRAFSRGQWSARYPCSIRLHTRPPRTKRKKNEKNFFKESLGYLVVCTVAIFSSKKNKKKLCTNFGPDS